MSDGTGVTSVWVADNKPEAAMPETNLSDVLEELRAIRSLLERQAAVLTWATRLQRDPFSPPVLSREQWLEECRSAREEDCKSTEAEIPAGRDSVVVATQFPPKQHGCSV